MKLSKGDKAPNFTIPCDSGTSLTLSDYRGQIVVLYFYPKDNTSGCTQQACDLTNAMPTFNALGCAVIGISKDSLASHKKFKAKYDLNYPLGSDEDGVVCDTYGVWVEKSMYGRRYMGIDRTTFLIDADGIIDIVWNKVKVSDHVNTVLKQVNALKNRRTDK